MGPMLWQAGYPSGYRWDQDHLLNPEITAPLLSFYRTGNNSFASFPTGQANNSSVFFSYKTGIKPHMDTRGARVSCVHSKDFNTDRAPDHLQDALHLAICEAALHLHSEPSVCLINSQKFKLPSSLISPLEMTSFFSHLASRDDFLPHQA